MFSSLSIGSLTLIRIISIVYQSETELSAVVWGSVTKQDHDQGNQQMDKKETQKYRVAHFILCLVIVMQT